MDGIKDGIGRCEGRARYQYETDGQKYDTECEQCLSIPDSTEYWLTL